MGETRELHCPECAAEVPAYREFCPKCGAPIHRSRRERLSAQPGARSDEELKRNRRKVLVIGAAILLAMGIAGKVSWVGTSIEHESEDRPRGPAVVQAQQLFDAYRDDPRAADKLYRRREMVVTGQFVRIAPDGRGDPDLRLATSDPQAPLGIDLIRASHEQATQLRPGQTITVSCERVDRTRDERWLRNCAIQTVKETEATAPAPAPASVPTPQADGNSG